MSSTVETVGRPAGLAVEELKFRKMAYRITRTAPTRSRLPLEPDNEYVVRCREDEDGTLHLTIAAAMGRED